MRARCLGSIDCSARANDPYDEHGELRVRYQDQMSNYYPSSGTKVSWGNEYFRLDDAYCPYVSYEADIDHDCDHIDDPARFNIFTATFGEYGRQNVVRAGAASD
ncbi:unnamed protein product [Symbiodinium pilosum]|uniref:Uncharacterized protein n=1 Tax=Symbiodinium pilosum TaxID=2952 RepID=A0A812S7J6_SYMPI|nr:unnamed protein product [Symbiodinium pilosum]